MKHLAYQLGRIDALLKLGADADLIAYPSRGDINSGSSVHSMDDIDELWRSIDRDSQFTEASKLAAPASAFGIGAALKIPGAAGVKPNTIGALPKVPTTPKPQQAPSALTPPVSPQQQIASTANNLAASTSMQSPIKRITGNVT